VAADGRLLKLAWPVFCVPAGTPASKTDGTPVRLWVPQYAPPEVIFGPQKGVIDSTVDLYGLGEVLYFMLAGTRAFNAKNAAAIGVAKARGVKVEPLAERGCSRETIEIVSRLLGPKAEDRFRSSSAVVENLRQALRLLLERGNASASQLLRDETG
ncbi:MAG: hypothetical protein ACSLFQ_22300, partial [Thermoanaerobaculia bacterium]